MRRWWFVLVALTFFVGSTGIASAESATNSGYTYVSWDDCAWVTTTIRNDWAQPHLDTIATMDRAGDFRQCGNQVAVAQPRELKVRQDLVYWDTQWQQAFWCNIGPWIINDWGPTHQIGTSWGWNSAPCKAPGQFGAWFYGVGRSATWSGGWHGENMGLGTDWIWAWS